MSGPDRLPRSLDEAISQLKDSWRLRQAETQARKRLENILDRLPSGVVVVEGAEAVITMVNRRALEIFGWSTQAGVPKPEHSAELNLLRSDGSPFPPEDQPLSRAAMHGEALLGEEVLIRHADGTVVTAVASAAPVYDGDRITGAVGAFEEITALKAVQEALERAYTRERRLSVMLQKALLPSIPKRIGNLLMAAEYRPAYKGDYMGGDFYDIFAPRPGLVGIVIGDVSGKGIQGAIRTALTKYTLRSYAYENPSPSSVMERTNNAVLAQSTSEGFVTVFYALFDTNERTLRFANAGHERPICLRSSTRQVFELPGGGMALGVQEGITYTENTVRLDIGDRMLLYTDGTTDARSGSDFFGIDRLEAFLHEMGAEPPKQFTSCLVQRLQEFSEGYLHDDVALLMICIG